MAAWYITGVTKMADRSLARNDRIRTKEREVFEARSLEESPTGTAGFMGWRRSHLPFALKRHTTVACVSRLFYRLGVKQIYLRKELDGTIDGN